MSVERGFDLQFREDELQVVQGAQPIATTAFSYHAPTGRIASISHGGSTATYDWSSTVAGLPVGISYSGAGLTGRRTPDEDGRLDKIGWSIGSQNVLSHDYTLDSRGRRTAAAREDGTHWDYGYNDRGEVTSAAQERADDTLLPGRGFGYAFDAIENRTQASVTFATPPPVQATTYTPNALNQYISISRTNPLRRVLQGIAHPGATIEVKLDSPTGQSRTVARVEPNGAGFIAEAEADTALAAVWRQVVVEASRPGVGVNGATVKTQRKGWLFFPPQNETLVYDKDGNLKEDARWLYTWDGENRLMTMEEKQIANSSLGQTPPARQRLEFAYDSQSRRVRKVVKVLQGQTWSVASDLRFVYDAWNLLAEFTMKPGTSNLELLRSYAWGYDLSGSEQGAGGVGGLVLVKQSQTIANNSNPPQTGALAPCYDGNGNILAYLDCASGDVTQRMEYDAFGNEMTLDSVLTGNNTSVREVPFRFSTKYTDSETSLSYYGYRFYSADLGRWPSRDPIEEKGGINLFGMVRNDAVNTWDVLGLAYPRTEQRTHDRTNFVQCGHVTVSTLWHNNPDNHLVLFAGVVITTYTILYHSFVTLRDGTGVIAYGTNAADPGEYNQVIWVPKTCSPDGPDRCSRFTECMKAKQRMHLANQPSYDLMTPNSNCQSVYNWISDCGGEVQ